MARSSKRSKTDLYAEVLEVITHYPEGVRITRLSYGVGVPVDRLKLLVEKLCSCGLARKSHGDEILYGVTRRGIEFLDTFWKMRAFLEEFGEESTN
ncbi:MAG TPA: winged helix-turn-helix domain-containing protein [Candidatus Dormibacteraeota bacterium]|nr:winged helix-turn-helix domain-containing protein [Candidatus Dormibacteraeota bacterium]